MNQPDILFIVLDTQRADRLGCYGYEKNITPNLDRFASDGTVFEYAVSPAQWTVPSHASMFSGEYPSRHQVTQSYLSMRQNSPHIAELLSAAGYETVGFCNNPLVGILNNGFKRGFKHFYNYGGAIPSLPHASSRLPWPLSRAEEWYTQFLRRISYPIQNYFGRSDLAFQISLQSWATPLWSKLANFKGQNSRSVQDVAHYLRTRENQNPQKPLFLFLNLMETHLPFWPPGRFVDQVAPYFRASKEARTIMRTWNREAYRWAAPLAEPLSELESRVLNDMYDAEVAYQDDYLGELFGILEQRKNNNNTLIVIVADHGDGLGEHGYMGHAFVAYQELVHVPLIVKWPSRFEFPERINIPVSTRRVFHTMLNLAGGHDHEQHQDLCAEGYRLSLEQTAIGRDPEQGTALSEIFPPLNFIKAIEKRQPELLKRFNCLSDRRAIIRADQSEVHKLIRLDDQPYQLFGLTKDPLELNNRLNDRPLLAKELDDRLTQTLSLINEDTVSSETDGSVAIDSQLLQRLRGLGYVD